ncbi:YaiI/YqxD family protein [Clostridium fallax]|uniref:UPF0178 protein SAMN05443638_1362 n=1 Tax=Clostridium fallax TaxID=1533 RepID=A0A1M4Z2F5_9CLOT|nr:YaiI/YqxD family protein [Clostridium fallax]SHF12239.1 hypothetical protein SAMN05443638_1362 [Clostridium fallax]SQB22286.1 YaiI/YqxD family protein [Clostridium fallax]
MKILVDGDACPGKHIIEKVAMENNIEVTIYCDLSHYIQSDYSKVVVVDSGFQSVDMYLINNAKSRDIIITQDYGVAAMALGKGVYAINPKGYIYNEDNIDRLLFERHIAGKARRAGKKTGTHKKRRVEDDIRLESNLRKLINNKE